MNRCQFENEDAIETIDDEENVDENSLVNAKPDDRSLNGNYGSSQNSSTPKVNILRSQVSSRPRFWPDWLL